MSLAIDQRQPVPLAADADGVFRVGGTRVTLESVIHQFQQGASAEQIQEDFPSLSLGDVYATIAYYLRHIQDVERYLRTQAQAAAETRREIESGQGTAGWRERLLRRQSHESS